VKSDYIFTHADGSGGVFFTSVCLSVCMFFLHYISNSDAAGITKLDTEMFHDESVLETHLFCGQKVKVTSNKKTFPAWVFALL